VKPKDRLRAWVWLLALTAARPEHTYDSLVVGRARSKAAEVTIAKIPPLAGDATTRRQIALEALTALVDLYDRGMQEPLPLACEASAAYAEAVYNGDDPQDAARYAWESGFNFDKEDRDPEHIAVHNGTLKWGELLAEQPHNDEHGPGWADSEATRFGRYARRLWDPLLEREQRTDQ
jgi:exodeoxyribonuclease V gamma subunit